MKQITYTKRALKTLRSMQKSRATAIVAKIEAYAEGQNVDAVTMKGSDLVRIRLGSWRIILDATGVVIAVLKIGPRGDVYKK